MPPKKQEATQTFISINAPEVRVRRHTHTIDEIAQGAKNRRASRIAKEFDDGLKFIRKYPKSVTFYGSARFKPSNPHYKDAHSLAYKISQLGYTIVTGGGPGIMEAANRGAREARGLSVGLNIQLPHEQILNPYVTDSLSFYYFFSRKTTLSFSAESYIFYPGGFGTLDEFYDIITLIQTKKIRRIPVILVGSDFWLPLEDFMDDNCYMRHGAIDKKDLKLYHILDDHDEIIKIVKKAPVRS